MLVEVQYHDEEGSVCPFCGNALNIMSRIPGYLHEKDDDEKNAFNLRTVHKERTIHGGYEVRLYPCECSMGHMTFLAQQCEEGDEYDYIMRAFVYHQDWEDHIDMAITAGAYEIDLCDDEDDAWIIHREMHEQMKEGNQCLNKPQLPLAHRPERLPLAPLSKAATKALDRQPLPTLKENS